MTDRPTNGPRELNRHQREVVQAAVNRALCGYDPPPVPLERTLVVQPNRPSDVTTVVRVGHSLKITKLNWWLSTNCARIVRMRITS